MAITIANLRITPYSQKDQIQKLVFGDEWSITVKLPTPHVAGDKYSIGLDYENTLYPPNRPLCAGTEAFILDGDELTFTLKLGTARMRDWCSKIRKPMPMAIQIVRVRNNKAETLLLDSLLALPSVFDGVVTVCEGDAIQILLDAKLDKPAVEGTAGQILSIDENGQCVWKDEQEIPEQAQANWDESDSSDPSFIQHKPTLSAVATSGSYNDLTDKPVIPEQAQADWDESDSTEASYIQHKPDLSAYSLVTETGNKLSMSIDEDYDLVMRLLDKHDNVLSTQDIDLPLEAMIVNASYASGVLTLTLQNGQTVDVDISDIVSGLVPDSRTINGQSLSADVTLTAQDLSLATVATSGDYEDLSNKPVIPEQEQANWDESDSSDPSYIKNKPVITESASKNYLTFQKAGPNVVHKVRIDKIGSPQDIDLEYSLDSGSTWTKYTWSGTTGYEISGIYTVMFRGNNSTICQSSSNGYRFVLPSSLDAKFIAYGDIMSLLDTTGTLKEVKDYCFYRLFKDCTSLTQAPEISATRYGALSCEEMFRGCTELKYIPKIYADFANSRAFYKMFEGCTSLTSANVEVNTAREDALYRMFYGCTSLRTLVFKTFSVERVTCMTMCGECTSLESVALSLGSSQSNQCYDNMFFYCTNLKHVVLDSQTFPSETGNWLDNVSSSGIFRCYKGVTIPSRDSSGVPSTWTVEYVDYLTEQRQADWDESESTDPAFILNKPSIPSESDINDLIADALSFHNN